MAEEILQKLLKKIVPAFAGPGSERLVDLLYKKQNVNEFLIAKKMDLTINQTRNILYKLADEGLVGFIRKKDKKKGGWYTYFWTLRMKKSLIRYKEELVNKLETIKTQLSTRETERHYFCKNCDLEYNEENAMIQEFTCAECGEVLEIMETEKITAHLRNEIKKLEEEILRVDQEIEILEDKEQKGNERKLKAEKKKKELERKERKKERDKEKARELKKLGIKPKKKVKKKVKKKSKVKTKKKPKKKVKKKSKVKKSSKPKKRKKR